MAPETRRVRRLHLRGPGEAELRRAFIALEDVLRTATLPDAGGRILLVRRLALGRIDPTGPRGALALRLERAMAGASVEIRHGTAPDADAAGAVWFRDALEAREARALRILAGVPARAWFWPLAVPECADPGTPAEALRAMAVALAGMPEAAAALPAWVATVVRAGGLEALTEALHPGDVPALARACGLGSDPGAGGGVEGPAPDPDVEAWTAARPHGDPTRVPTAAPEAEPVRRFLLRASRLGGGPGSVARPEAGRPAGPPAARGREAALRARGVGEEGSPGGRPEAGTRASGPAGAERDAALPADAAAGRGGLDAPADTGARAAPSAPEAARTEAGGEAGPVEADEAGPEGPRRLSGPLWAPPTVAGGLLFLAPALVRLGYPEWLRAHPGWAPHDVARALLASVLDALDVPEADPARLAVRRVPSREPLPPDFVAPARWREGLLRGRGALRLARSPEAGAPADPPTAWLHDPSGRLLLGAWSGPPPEALRSALPEAAPASARPRPLDEAVVEAWGVALRRWLRRYARIGLAELVLRPGELAVTPTHLDVRLEASDLAVRRAGLDLDPGWLPWLGRVVRFHYGPAGWP